MDIEEIKLKVDEVIKSINGVVLGYEREVKLLLTCLLANGHVLFEGVPGVAKTTLVKALVKLLGLYQYKKQINGIVYKGFSRIQFTPDLMPSDITGSLIYDPSTRQFEPRLGPIFSYIVLADEINRAVPRTQSALLQAMQEKEVTIGNRTYPLELRDKDKFFFVLATQNPVEQEATYPLPEAQLDRFLMRIIIGYPPTLEVEKNIYRLHMDRLTEPFEDLKKIVDPSWIIKVQEFIAEKVKVCNDALEYTTILIRNTRPQIFEPVSEYFELGASPRAGIALIRAAKAHAVISRGVEEVERVDIDSVLFPVLNHRLIPNFEKLVDLESRGERFLARYKLLEDGIKYIKENI